MQAFGDGQFSFFELGDHRAGVLEAALRGLPPGQKQRRLLLASAEVLFAPVKFGFSGLGFRFQCRERFIAPLVGAAQLPLLVFQLADHARGVALQARFPLGIHFELPDARVGGFEQPLRPILLVADRVALGLQPLEAGVGLPGL